MSEELRLKFRRLEARTLKAFQKGFSVLLAVFLFTVLLIVFLHFLYSSYATGLLVVPSVVVIAEALLAGLDFLFEWLAGDTTYEQAEVEPPNGSTELESGGSFLVDDARMVSAGLKASREVGKKKKKDAGA